MEKGPLGILPKGPLRAKVFRGATLKTIVKLFREGYPFVVAVVDKNQEVVDWWEAKDRGEAEIKIRNMVEGAYRRDPDRAPYTGYIIQTSSSLASPG